MGENTNKKSLVPNKLIESKILVIRSQKVMIDADIAQLYGVTTTRLNEQVKRNKDRFPNNFMFELTKEEKSDVIANCDHLENLKFSPFLPKVFTEHGILMVANVLKSERAIKVSIQIIQVFVKMREMLLTHNDLFLRMEKLERNIGKHDMQIAQVFQLIKQFVKEEIPGKTIGY